MCLLAINMCQLIERPLMKKRTGDFVSYSSVVLIIFIVDEDATMSKIKRDIDDYDTYGGNIPPRPYTEAKLALTCKGIIPEKEHKANFYDFAATRSKWVNKDFSATPEFKSLSPAFQRMISTAKVTYLYDI